LGTLTWEYRSSGSVVAPYFYANYGEKIAYPGALPVHPIDAVCSQYKVVVRSGATFVDYTLCGDGGSSVDQIQVKDPRYTDAATFKTSVSGVQLVYELATPLTYQLTPKQIAALTDNYVWASNGASITVTVSDVLHDFQGWLLKVGSGMTLVPTEMIKAETYKVSPNQRMEETAERDSTGVLWRETVPNMPPKIEFNTPAAYDTDVNALNAIFRAAYSNEQERKLTVAFYDPEENVYKSWECYMPNIDFPIRTIDIDAKTIFYDEIRYAFIGY
jgi:hypothetical protein